MSERISDRSVFEYIVVGLAAMVYVLFTSGHTAHPSLRVDFTPASPAPLKPAVAAPEKLDLPPSPKAPQLFTLYQAARDGDPEAAFDLGNIYAAGLDAPPDYEMAARWFSRAAAQGLADAQYNLAVFYAKGYVGDHDPARALPLFEAAAAQGLADAEVALGLMYRDGVAINRDYVKAWDLFLKAARQGDPVAYSLLAVSCEGGLGVKRDRTEALKWQLLAERRGRPDPEFHAHLVGVLTPAQQNDARARADAFEASLPTKH